MNLFRLPALRILRSACLAAAATILMCAAIPVAVAAPGAHGPNGEHLDEQRSATGGAALPRVEAKSELFELVAQINNRELTIVIDRYATNEPVLGAKLDVESGSLKAVAAFRADSGDYAVTDAALIEALSTPGEHALVFTVVAGQDADLLDGTLVTAGSAATADDHGHSHDGEGAHDHELERAAWIGAGIVALGLIGAIAWWRQRRRERAGSSKGVQS